MKKLRLLVFGGCFVTTLCHAGTVTVSNYPLFLLSNAVTGDTPPAHLLLPIGDVGHHGSLSPSGVKLVQDSDFVVWFGHELEQNLVKTLENAPNTISLFKFRAFERLPLRGLDGTPKPNTFDPHIWLEPNNAKAIVRALTVIHSHANPKYKHIYQQNAQQFHQDIDKVVATISTSAMPYWAYHDSFAYLEKSARLIFAGALTPDHHLSPKVSQIRLLSENRPSAQMCLLAQTPVSEGIKTKLGNVHTLVTQEDMSDGAEFISTWQQTVKNIYACVHGK